MNDPKVNLFISYSHKDKDYQSELLTHLSPIRRNKHFDTWHDGQIDAGDDWENKIVSALKEADIILLLISANFIDSEYCYVKEMEIGLSRHKIGEAIVIPVLIKNCFWQETPFANIQAVPSSPIDSFDNKDDAFTEIAETINKEVNFQFHLKKGDQLLNTKKYAEAKEQYELAEKIKSNKVVEKRLEKVGQIENGTFENSPTKEANFNVINDARFISDGFIGLQKQINTIESSVTSGRGYERLAVLGHLPSFMRINPLKEAVGRILYYNWEPEYYIPDYVKLVNERSQFFKAYIENGGISRDIFFKKSISNYVNHRFTFHDKNEDPIEEIEERLKTLKHYNRERNYYLYLIEEEKTVPKFILKTNVGLVIDLRTTEVNKHFTHSIDGLFTQSDDIIREFTRKFSNLIDSQNINRVQANDEFLSDLLDKIQSFKNEN